MANPRINTFLLYLLLLSALVLKAHCNQRKLHIVYMGDRHQGDGVSLASTHHSMLQTVLGSYERSFNGFAAMLTKQEAARISEMNGVVSVFPNQMLQLHTTRSWDFMGFSAKAQTGNPVEGDVIIGLLDSGVWPEHPSFNDTGYGPPPAKWKGTCQTQNFTCNNKIIGARYYMMNGRFIGNVTPSARDTDGHGTHTASIAAGVELPGTSYFGLAEGLARGGTPNARIAVYKVCWGFFCGTAGILKAFDDAIADGVDIISASMGSLAPHDYFYDPIAIGSFHAMKNGILTSNSAGNEGPRPASIVNFVPWTLSVAASTIDRKFVSRLALGNGQILTGITINTFDLNGTSYPLVWAGDAFNRTAGYSSDGTADCLGEGLNQDMISGSIVLCGTIGGASNIPLANGVGVIMTDSNSDYALNFAFPGIVINPSDATKVFDYIKSNKYPVATILLGETWKDAMAPTVAQFSARGPSPFSPDILKPDIAAPGVDILASWSPVAGPSLQPNDPRSVLFSIASGTSMSCPHATATAAYIKAAHPDWSPAAIKSAIMTTAYIMDPRRHADLEFAYGSGRINPTAALDPGLVFNASATDYVNFLCKIGYNSTTLRILTGDNSTCANTTVGRAWDLNYPSFSLYVEDGQPIYGTFVRTVTNVGAANSTYTVTMDMPPLINVTIEPSVLTFSSIGETQSFAVKVTGPVISPTPIISGSIKWSDGTYVVRTPLVVHNYIPGAPYTVDSEDSDFSEQIKHIFTGSRKNHRRRRNYRSH